MFSPDCEEFFRCAVCNWLSRFSPQPPAWTATPWLVQVNCQSAADAELMWRSRHRLIEAIGREIQIKLLVCDREYAVHPLPCLTLEGQDLGNLMDEAVLVVPQADRPDRSLVAEYLIALDTPTFTCVDVFAPIAQRLNRAACVGKPLDYLDFEVAHPRRLALEALCVSGQAQEFSYLHGWQGFNWQFGGQVAIAERRPEFDFDKLARLKIYDLQEWQIEAWASRSIFR